MIRESISITHLLFDLIILAFPKTYLSSAIDYDSAVLVIQPNIECIAFQRIELVHRRFSGWWDLALRCQKGTVRLIFPREIACSSFLEAFP